MGSVGITPFIPNLGTWWSEYQLQAPDASSSAKMSPGEHWIEVGGGLTTEPALRFWRGEKSSAFSGNGTILRKSNLQSLVDREKGTILRQSNLQLVVDKGKGTILRKSNLQLVVDKEKRIILRQSNLQLVVDKEKRTIKRNPKAVSELYTSC